MLGIPCFARAGVDYVGPSKGTIKYKQNKTKETKQKTYTETSPKSFVAADTWVIPMALAMAVVVV